MTSLTIADFAGPDETRRARELAQMRALALGVLLAMAALFVAASLAQRRWEWAGYVRAFAEAGLVGGLADWFAVTALFRRPLGLPIPHTGIIPRSKQRIGYSLGAFIADNFLTVAVLDEKLRQIQLARWGGRWLRRRRNARRLAAYAMDLVPQILALSPKRARRQLAAGATRGLVRATPAAPLLAKLLQALWREGRAQPTLDRLLESLGPILAEREALVLDQVRGRTPRWLPKWVGERISSKVLEALVEIVGEMRAPDHPWRQELHAAVESWTRRLETDPVLAARIEEVKAALLADPRLAGHLSRLQEALEAKLAQPAGRRRRALVQTLAQVLTGLGEWLDGDEAAQAALNDWARAAARQLVAPQRHRIGGFIAQVVAGWDTRSVVDKLELQVGKDLQYIRINGALVGGLAGLAIYAVARATGLD